MNTPEHTESRSAPSRLNRFLKGIHFCLYRLVKPRSNTEDSRRRELIFNITILAIIVLISCLGMFMFYYAYIDPDYHYVGIKPSLFLLFLSLFIYLYSLSRHGYYIIGAYIFIGLYFAVVTYAAYIWGPNLPIALLNYALLIIITSVLLGTRNSIILTIIVTGTLISIGKLSSRAAIDPMFQWNKIVLERDDPIEYSILLIIIMGISWLSNREIEKSLARARRSEGALRQERDLLELRVEERTRELRRAQSEKVGQLYRFAEFGRLASGIFHDLANPLTLLTNTVENLQRSSASTPEIDTEWQRAKTASRRMETFMTTVKKQLQHQSIETDFSINSEVEESIGLCQYKALKQNLNLDFQADKEFIFHGNPFRFNQIITNLICNAVDAYEDVAERPPEKKVITISITQEKPEEVRIAVHDYGSGIKPEVLPHIFEPFFTTKSEHKGIGLGLSTTKEIVERVLHGKIEVTSTPEAGTTFTIIVSTEHLISHHDE